jgi:hypothetical protein
MIDPPSPQLLAVHSAIAQILHLSAAGRYIDNILENLDQKDIRQMDLLSWGISLY